MMPARKEHAGLLKKDPTEIHEGLAAYIEKTTGHTVPVGDVALVQRLYPIYLKSPEVVKAREAASEERRQKAEAARAEKEARLRKRLEDIEAQRAKVLSDLGIAPTEDTVLQPGGFQEPLASEPEPVDPDDVPEVKEVTLTTPEAEDEPTEPEVSAAEVAEIVATDQGFETDDDDEWEDF